MCPKYRMEFVPREKATAIREPSTANLLIDSIDRIPDEVTPQPSTNFTITRQNSLLNGFFTRMAVAEVVLDWSIPNVASAYNNNTIQVNIADAIFTITITGSANYTIAQVLNKIVSKLNIAIGTEFFSIVGDVPNNGYSTIQGTNDWFFTPNPSINILAVQLGLPLGAPAVPTNFYNVTSPALLPITYLDFCCDQLTYNQSLKDETTNTKRGNNVLYRWVFGWEGEASVDTLGYPIYQGYQPFRARRILPFPKQVRWESSMPVGQLNFQVYGSDGNLVLTSPPAFNLEWNMNLLVSEV